MQDFIPYSNIPTPTAKEIPINGAIYHLCFKNDFITPSLQLQQQELRITLNPTVNPKTITMVQTSTTHVPLLLISPYPEAMIFFHWDGETSYKVISGYSDKVVASTLFRATPLKSISQLYNVDTPSTSRRIAGNVTSLRFWLTYDTGGPIVLTGAGTDKYWETNILLYINQSI